VAVARPAAAGRPTAPLLAMGGQTMGTCWSVKLAADPAQAQWLRRQVQLLLDALVDDLSHWDDQSALARFNRTPPGRWVDLPPALGTVLAEALRLAELSGGAFDPTIGRLVDLWGFGPAGPVAGPPSAAAVAGAAAARWRNVELDHGRARWTGPGRLDLSAIAKGHAVDALGALLSGAGISDWLVEVGGETKAAGFRPDGLPWWIDVEQPPLAAAPRLRLGLSDHAAATSGTYRRWFVHQGKAMHHNIDPASGAPADTGLASVTVVARSAMVADGWASALMVTGPARGLELCRAHRISARMLASDGRREYHSPAFARLLE
jgi:thiamine biosynthesis lipoprotein